MNPIATFARFPAFFGALLLALACSGANAAVLYASSIHTVFSGTGPRVECNLYKIDPATGKAEIIAPVRQDSGEPVAIISLAFHPQTKRLYGATARQVGSNAILVEIDPASGRAAAIGPLAKAVSDIAFDDHGRLFGWLPDSNQLALIEPRDASFKMLGPSGIQGLMGGGMVIGSKDEVYVAATGASGTLDQLDLATGSGRTGPALDGAPFLSAITNLTFSPDGKLYAVNSNMGSPANTALVIIDPASGRVQEVGRLPPDSHGLIFLPETASATAPRYLWWLVIALVVAAIVAPLMLRSVRRASPR